MGHCLNPSTEPIYTVTDELTMVFVGYFGQFTNEVMGDIEAKLKVYYRNVYKRLTLHLYSILCTQNIGEEANDHSTHIDGNVPMDYLRPNCKSKP